MPPEVPPSDSTCDESYFAPWKPSYTIMEPNTQAHIPSAQQTKTGEMSSPLKNWEESSFREWIYSSPLSASASQQHYQDSHHKEIIEGSFSPGMPVIAAGPSVPLGNTAVDSGGSSSGSLSRSPRSADLVGLLRKRQASDRSRTQVHVKLQDLEYKDTMGADGKDIKGKGKATESDGRVILNPLRLSNELFRQRDIESQGYWSEYIDSVCRIDGSNYDFANVDFGMKTGPGDNDERRNVEYLPSSPNYSEASCSSPTRSRGRLGCFELDMSYEDMDIGQLMSGMDVDSDETEDDLPDDTLKSVCFRKASSLGVGNSKAGAEKGKRKASPAGLEGPNMKRRHVGHGERAASLPHPFQHEHCLFF